MLDKATTGYISHKWNSSECKPVKGFIHFHMRRSVAALHLQPVPFVYCVNALDYQNSCCIFSSLNYNYCADNIYRQIILRHLKNN